MLEPLQLAELAMDLFAASTELDGVKVLITAGPTRELIGGAVSPATRQREVAAERGLKGLVAWLCDGFLG